MRLPASILLRDSELDQPILDEITYPYGEIAGFEEE